MRIGFIRRPVRAAVARSIVGRTVCRCCLCWGLLIGLWMIMRTVFEFPAWWEFKPGCPCLYCDMAARVDSPVSGLAGGT